MVQNQKLQYKLVYGQGFTLFNQLQESEQIRESLQIQITELEQALKNAKQEQVRSKIKEKESDASSKKQKGGKKENVTRQEIHLKIGHEGAVENIVFNKIIIFLKKLFKTLKLQMIV